jgi:hypothetical protein
MMANGEAPDGHKNSLICKGVGLSRKNIDKRATEQFGPGGGRYFAVAHFPEMFCGSSSPDYTAKHTFALEAIESYFLICLGGLSV